MVERVRSAINECKKSIYCYKEGTQISQSNNFLLLIGGRTPNYNNPGYLTPSRDPSRTPLHGGSAWDPSITNTPARTDEWPNYSSAPSPSGVRERERERERGLYAVLMVFIVVINSYYVLLQTYANPATPQYDNPTTPSDGSHYNARQVYHLMFNIMLSFPLSLSGLPCILQIIVTPRLLPTTTP